MLVRLRRVPGLRSRSSVEFGVYFAIITVLTFSAAFTVLGPRVLQDPPDQLLATAAGVGSAIFISYSVGVSGLFRQIRRGSDTELLLGFLTGLSLCGIFGVGLAVILLGVHKPFGWLGDMALAWTASSLIFLAGIVASLPLFAYEDSRIKHLNHDE